MRQRTEVDHSVPAVFSSRLANSSPTEAKKAEDIAVSTSRVALRGLGEPWLNGSAVLLCFWLPPCCAPVFDGDTRYTELVFSGYRDIYRWEFPVTIFFYPQRIRFATAVRRSHPAFPHSPRGGCINRLPKHAIRILRQVNSKVVNPMSQHSIAAGNAGPKASRLFTNSLNRGNILTHPSP
jgi:hypothetical protein